MPGLAGLGGLPGDAGMGSFGLAASACPLAVLLIFWPSKGGAVADDAVFHGFRGAMHSHLSVLFLAGLRGPEYKWWASEWQFYLHSFIFFLKKIFTSIPVLFNCILLPVSWSNAPLENY